MTTLDAQYESRTVYVEALNHITFEGFTITGGQAPAFGDYTGGGYFNHASGDTVQMSAHNEEWNIFHKQT